MSPLLLITALAISLLPISFKLPQVYISIGPRISELYMRFYENQTSAYRGLLDYEINIVDWPFTFEEAKALNCYVLWAPSVEGKLYAYNDVLGMCSTNYSEPINIYTYMNAMASEFPGELKIGLVGAPAQINQIYSGLRCELQVLAGFMDEPLYPRPYDVTVNNPWRARDWLVSTWVDPEDGAVKTQVTWWYHEGVKWIKPITGEALKGFDAEDVEFSVWYHYQTPDSYVHVAYKDVHSVVRHDSYRVTIRFDSLNEGFLYSGFARQLPKASGWLKPPLTTIETRSWTNLTLPGRLPLPRQTVGAPVEVIDVLINEAPAPAQIVKGYVYVNATANAGDVVTAIYRARGHASGFYLGGLPWWETLIGTGPFYITDIVPDVGGLRQV